MAYRAEIEIAVKGARELNQFQNKLRATALEVEQLNNVLKNFADEAAGVPRSLSNLNRQLQEASQAFNEVALGTKEAKTAASDYLAATKNLNAGLKERADLLAEVAENERKARLASRGIQERTQYKSPLGPFQATALGTEQALVGQTSPIDPKRLLDIKNDQLALDRALFDLAKKTAEPLNVQLQLQEGLIKGAQEALELAQRARGLNQFPGGVPIPGGLKSEQAIASAAAKRTETLAVEQRIQRTAASTVTQYNLQLSVLQRLAAIGKQINESTEKELVNQRRISRQVRIRRGRETQRRRRDALSSGLIGGAFPLLFGQGAGAAVGGGLGGAAGGFAGGQLGFGLSLVGTALGSAFDNLINKSQELGQALNPLTADLDAVIKAAGLAGTEGEKLIKSIENIAGAEKAQQVAAEQLAVVVGKDGVEALQDLGKASTKLNNELAKSFTALQAAIAPLLAELLNFVASNIERTRLVNKAVTGTLQVRPEFAQNQVITGAVSQFKGGQIDELELQKRITEEVKKQEIAQQNIANTKLQQIAGSRNELEQAELLSAVLKNSSDLTNKTVQQAEEKLILKRMEAKETEIFRRWQKEEITNAQLQLELQTLSLETDNERLKLKERIANATKRSADEAERERKEQERTLKAQRDSVNRALGSAASIRVKELEFETKRAKFDKTALEAAKVELNQNQAIHAVNKLILGDKYGQAIEDAKSSKEREILIGNYATEVSLLEDSYKLKQDILKTTIAQKEAEQAIADLKAAAGFDFMSLADRTTPFATGYGQSTGPVGFAEGAQLAPIIQQELAIDRLLEKYKEIGEAAQLAGELVTFGFRDMVSGAKSAEQVFADFLNSLADMLLRTAQQMIAQYIAIGIARMFAIGGSPASFVKGVDLNQNFFTGSGIPFGGGMANGGPVSGGTPYMVGERGPELFVPRSSGTIVPNNALGGGSSNVVVNVDATGSKVSGDNDQASQLGRVIGAAVQAELVKQKRPGGLLAQT